MSTELTRWVQEYVAEASRDDRVDAFVDRVDDAILAALPELAADPALVADLHASTRAQFVVFLSLLERVEQQLLLPPQAVDLALSIARRQFELPVLLTVYRVAADQVWKFFCDVAEQVPANGPPRFDVLTYLWDHGGTWINRAVEQLIGVFHTERDVLRSGALARRTETVHALIRGDDVPPDEATTLLEHPARGVHTALVLWSERDTSDSLTALNRTIAALAQSAGAAELSVAAGRGVLWCWLTAPQPLATPRLEVAFLATGPPDHRVAVGCPGVDLEGFRDSHREAVEAQRHAFATDSGDAFTAYSDVELACLTAGNEEGVRALVRRELGSLATEASGNERLRATLLSYLDNGGSVERTAAELFIHKNTVRYRLAQAEEQLGHSLTERRGHLTLALHALPRLNQ